MNHKFVFHHRFQPFVFLALAIASFACNFTPLKTAITSSFQRILNFQKRSFQSSDTHIDTPRQLIHSFLPQHTSLYMIREKTDEISSIERSRHLAFAWECLPENFRSGPTNEINNSDAVVVPKNPLHSNPPPILYSQYHRLAIAIIYLCI